MLSLAVFPGIISELTLWIGLITFSTGIVLIIFSLGQKSDLGIKILGAGILISILGFLIILAGWILFLGLLLTPIVFWVGDRL